MKVKGSQLRRIAIEFLCLLTVLTGAPLQAAQQAGQLRQQARVRVGAAQQTPEPAISAGQVREAGALAFSSSWTPVPALAALLSIVTGLAQAPKAASPPRPPSKGKTSTTNQRPTPLDPALKSVDQIPVAAQWNLISLPKQPVDPAITVVLQAIGGQYDEVWTFEGCDSSDPWKSYQPSDLAGSDLAVLDHQPGIWLQGPTQTTLPVDGIVPSATTYQLCEGWNLIGYPSIEPRHPESVLSPIDGKWVRLFGYDPFDPDDLWQGYDHQAPHWANNLPAMQPGKGYWLLVTEDTTLEIANQGAPPEVDLVTPDDLAVVTEPTDVIGTVQSPLLRDWSLSYRAAAYPGTSDQGWQRC